MTVTGRASSPAFDASPPTGAQHKGEDARAPRAVHAEVADVGPAPERGARLFATASTHAREAMETVYAARLAPPTSPSPLNRLAYGAGLPLAVVGALLAHPDAGRRYRRVCFTQAAVVLALGLLFGGVLERAINLLWGMDSRGPWGQGASWITLVSAFYATLSTVEWCVIALSRQYHDAIGRDAALLTGAEPEDPAFTPQVKVDLHWVMKRVRRYVRGWIAFTAGLPGLALLWLVPGAGAELYAVASTLWGAYWLIVLVAAKSAHAWKEEGSAPSPWFRRGWDELTTTAPGFRWWLPRSYGQLLRRATSQLDSPAAAFERAPWEMMGVAFARVLGGLPLFYLLVRPIIPVAAQHVLRGQRERELERQSKLLRDADGAPAATSTDLTVSSVRRRSS
ncbi:hypothetical protein [Chondromyces crocatus]|uniref:Uncharacterized protein n=1 Tax=Chondromyces crocatus TaxID=52 RepID=A0A0K1EI25_CHOCO|nr:hypothetical protein [Chondromyces crocatus]AKT40509.1 uncharacterized protein CMC5_046640 [Chondromyces crocatus]